MTKKPDLLLNGSPVNLSERETPSQRLWKLRGLLAQEKASAKPCKAYIEDLGISIQFVEQQMVRNGPY